MFLRKIKYGLSRFVEDILGNEDYWHSFMKARKLNDNNSLYFVDISQKGIYPFELKDGLPIVLMNGNPILFSITIFNYGLGLIDRINEFPEEKSKIFSVLNWAISTIEKDGGWHNNYSEASMNLKVGWTSAMGQGLGISFIYRCYILGYIDRQSACEIIVRAKNHMQQQGLYYETKFGKILQEFGGTKKSVLNGYIFAILGLYDYGRLTEDYIPYKYHIAVIKQALPHYKLLTFWSYYSMDKVFSSVFYHKLHIELLKVLYYLEGDADFLDLSKLWTTGLRLKYIFIVFKSFQKVVSLKSVTILNKL